MRTPAAPERAGKGGVSLKITLTEAALSYLAEQKVSAVTIASLVFSSCCSGPLPPEVKPGPPTDPEGFAVHAANGVQVYYDSLLDPRPQVIIDLKEFPLYRELFVHDWD